MDKISEARKSEIVEMYKAKMEPSLIAAECDVAIETVYKVLRQEGVDLGDRFLRKWSPEQLDEIVTQYNSGMAITEVCRTYDISGYQQLYEILRRLGIPPRTHSKAAITAKNEQLDRAIQMYLEGEPIWFIIEETGISQPKLHQTIHSRGIQLRRPQAK
jgi:transposase-like protein